MKIQAIKLTKIGLATIIAATVLAIFATPAFASTQSHTLPNTNTIQKGIIK